MKKLDNYHLFGKNINFIMDRDYIKTFFQGKFQKNFKIINGQWVVY